MKRIIDTKVPNTAVNKDIFHSVIGQLSDGIWENSPACTAYWLCCDIDANGDTIKLVIDSEPIVRWGNDYINNRYFKMSDMDIFYYFIRKMLQIVKIEGRDAGDEKLYLMNAHNQTELDYMSYDVRVRVCDVWAVRKMLMEVAR